MIKQRRFWITAVLAWIVFIGIDFLFHASLLEKMWQEEVKSIKPDIDLFILIPVGYSSFFLLTVLVGYAFTKIYQEKPRSNEVIGFSLIFCFLFTGSNLLAFLGFVDIPLKQVVIYNVVYFIEISAVIFIFYKAMFRKKINRIIWYSILTFFVLFLIGITIQNLT